MDWNLKIMVAVILSLSQFDQLLGQESNENVQLLQSETNESISTTPEPNEDYLIEAANEFGYKLLLNIMNRSENSNVVLSPAGITGLLGMALLGSTGNTYSEIADNLGFSQDIITNRKHHEQLGSLLRDLNGLSSQTQYADAIFVDESTRLREVYRTYLNSVYNGDALVTAFADGAKARKDINEWVKFNTKGKIDDFLKKILPVSTKAVLLSALYFSGQWEQPFLPEYTTKQIFNTPTKEVMADLMINYGSFNYIFSPDDELHMIAFPYNDSVTTMYVLKPRFNSQLDISTLMNRINYTKIDSLINKMVTAKCLVKFPKMEIKSNVNLELSLKALGIHSMFSPEEANFALMIDGNKVVNKTEVDLISRINSGEWEARRLKQLVNELVNPGVYVDSVLHEVNIKIDEYGTEAVAVSSAVMARTAKLFYADSPFYMFIRNEKTKLVTFSAVIYDPTVQ